MKIAPHSRLRARPFPPLLLQFHLHPKTRALADLSVCEMLSPRYRVPSSSAGSGGGSGSRAGSAMSTRISPRSVAGGGPSGVERIGSRSTNKIFLSLCLHLVFFLHFRQRKGGKRQRDDEAHHPHGGHGPEAPGQAPQVVLGVHLHRGDIAGEARMFGSQNIAKKTEIFIRRRWPRPTSSFLGCSGSSSSPLEQRSPY